MVRLGRTGLEVFPCALAATCSAGPPTSQPHAPCWTGTPTRAATSSTPRTPTWSSTAGRRRSSAAGWPTGATATRSWWPRRWRRPRTGPQPAAGDHRAGGARLAGAAADRPYRPVLRALRRSRHALGLCTADGHARGRAGAAAPDGAGRRQAGPRGGPDRERSAGAKDGCRQASSESVPVCGAADACSAFLLAGTEVGRLRERRIGVPV
jgi:hypothetical protein